MPIGEICTVVSGSTPRRSEPSYWGGDIDWVTPKDLTNLEGAILTEAPEKITRSGYESCSTSMLPEGAVLFSSRAPIGLTAIAGKPMCTNQGFKSLIPGPRLRSGYLYWCMRYMTPVVQAQGTGSTFTEVSKRVLERIALPVPPLAEQRRIADILDRADAIRRKRRAAIALTEELLRSTFRDMFGDPVTNPKGWRTTTLSRVVRNDDRINYGVVQPGKHHTDGVPLLRVGDFQSGAISDGGLKLIEPAIESKYARSRLKGDEVVVACVGSIGSVALAQECHRGFNIARAVARIRLDADTVCRQYMLWYLRTSFVQQYFQAEARTVAQPTLNIRQLKETPVLLPPLGDQKRFANTVRVASAMRQRLETAADEADTLFHALTQRAFRGDL